MTQADPPVRHEVTRIRRETRRRRMTVVAIQRLSPHMLRIQFESPDLVGFESAAPDDHIKLFVPDLTLGDAGELHAFVRDYTPRSFDPQAGTLTVDFAIHEAGPATRWALDAAPGDTIEMGGPRGSTVVADDFDWYLLIGDETAYPAIARRVEELRPGARIHVLIAIDGEDDVLPLSDREGLDVRWVMRGRFTGGDEALLIQALEDMPFPAGEGYVWIAAEAAVARALRSFVVDQLGHKREWTKAAGYWSTGAAGTHETIKD